MFFIVFIIRSLFYTFFYDTRKGDSFLVSTFILIGCLAVYVLVLPIFEVSLKRKKDVANSKDSLLPSTENVGTFGAYIKDAPYELICCRY